jgi:hypothetical protein
MARKVNGVGMVKRRTVILEKPLADNVGVKGGID